MSERQAKTPTLRALLPSRLVPEDMLSEWQGPILPNTKNYASPPDSMRGRMGDVLMQGIAALGGFTGLPMGGEGSKAALLGELLAAGMPLVGGIKALPGAKVLAGPAWEKALRFYAEAGGLAERHVPRMANALQRAGIKVPARSVAEKVAAHKIVNEALDLAHTPAGPVEGPFATPQGIKAFHGTTDQALRVPDPQMAVEVPGAAFFSSNQNVADQYQWPREYGEIIDGPRGQVIEANLDLQNPMTVDFGGDVGDAIRLEKLVREAKEKGHDALVVHNVDDSVDSSQILGTTYAVFNKEQIQFVKKYGIAGALSAGAISELEARQMQAQGYQ